MNDISTQEEAFWEALEANPLDNTTRLVFADWLQEQKDPSYKIMRLMAEEKLVPIDSSYEEFRRGKCYWSDKTLFSDFISHPHPPWRIDHELFKLLKSYIGGPEGIKYYASRYEADRDLIAAYRKLNSNLTLNSTKNL